MKKGKAYIQTVNLICPYCGGDVVDAASGSLVIEWDSYGKLICLDCSQECAMPRTVETGSGRKDQRK